MPSRRVPRTHPLRMKTLALITAFVVLFSLIGFAQFRGSRFGPQPATAESDRWRLSLLPFDVSLESQWRRRQLAQRIFPTPTQTVDILSELHEKITFSRDGSANRVRLP